MTNVVRLDDLLHEFPPPATADEDGGPPDDLGALVRLWCMLLLMAIRDHATSLHYHPWREDGGLAYVVGEVRHVLDPPPPGVVAGPFLAVARSLFTEPGCGGWIARLCRQAEAGAACAAFTLDVSGDLFVWDAVVWSSGERSGVELFRVAPGVAPGSPDAGPRSK